MKNNQLRYTLCTLLLLAGSLFTPFTGFAQIVPEPSAKQLEALDKAMAPNRKKVTDILEADKTGQYKTYLADLEALAKAAPEQKRELEANLQSKHYEFIKKAYQRAVINHEEMRRSVAKILGHNNFTLSEFGGIEIGSVAPQLAAPVRFDGELLCPLEITEDESNSNLVSFCHTDARSCDLALHSCAEVAGGCRGKASTGGKLDLPEGTFQKITVSAQFDGSYEGFAFALGGYGQSTAKIGVRLQGPSFDKIVIVRQGTCVAPLVWYNKITFDGNNFNAQGVFTGNFPGENAYTAQIYNETFALSVVLASFTEVFCFSHTIDFIRLSATTTN